MIAGGSTHRDPLFCSGSISAHSSMSSLVLCAEVGDVVQDGCCLSQTLLDVISLNFLCLRNRTGVSCSCLACSLLPLWVSEPFQRGKKLPDDQLLRQTQVYIPLLKGGRVSATPQIARRPVNCSTAPAVSANPKATSGLQGPCSCCNGCP